MLSPQWGSNSKDNIKEDSGLELGSFSPRNGEVILKWQSTGPLTMDTMFQSPQWGSNSKAGQYAILGQPSGFSPRNGEVILKQKNLFLVTFPSKVSVPAMGK